jgi:AcrR family transcriptional regulator
MHETDGLRERKKAQTRAALSAAALQLAVERGADAVTADAIARAADVSLRTFHNYFASKEDAFLAPFQAVLERAAEELRARPADEHILESLEQVWLQLATDRLTLPQDTLAQVALLWTTPAMETYQHHLAAEAVRLFAGPIGERTGTDARVDLYPTLVAAAAVVTIFTAMEHCGARGSDDPDHTAWVVHQGFDILRSGFRPPGSQ